MLPYGNVVGGNVAVRNKSPRAKFIENVDLKRLAGFAWDAMQLASRHDPDLEKRIQLEHLQKLSTR
jgi:hypothetical protein